LPELLAVMASRSRRGSTMASSIATQSLARQRDEMHELAATRYPTGKRKAAARPKKPHEPKPKKPRRPRRWAPAGWDGNRWSARSIHPAGLETNHVPDMSSFRDAANEASGGLSWLRPHNRVSIWEHLAEVDIREGRAATASSAYGLAPVAAVSHSSSRDDGGGTSCGDTVKKAAPQQHPTDHCVASRPDALHDAARLQLAGDKTGLIEPPKLGMAVMRKSMATTSDGNDLPSPQEGVLTTPATTSCSAERISILSLITAP
jgi:hypothetical protein